MNKMDKAIYLLAISFFCAGFGISQMLGADLLMAVAIGLYAACPPFWFGAFYYIRFTNKILRGDD